MAYQSIGLGSSANDGTGDTLRAGGDKANDNFVELYTLLGTGSALTSGMSATATVVTLTAPVIATSLDLNGSELILDVDADTSFILTSLNWSMVKYVSTFSSSLKNPSCIHPYFARLTKKGANDDDVAPPIVTETELDNVSSLLLDGNTVPPPFVFS